MLRSLGCLWPASCVEQDGGVRTQTERTGGLISSHRGLRSILQPEEEEEGEGRHNNNNTEGKKDKERDERARRRRMSRCSEVHSEQVVTFHYKYSSNFSDKWYLSK